MRAAIYLRVSTDGQTTANQERELRAAAERIGHEIVAVCRMRTSRARKAGISGPASITCTRTPPVADLMW
jgi:DNA invertase Pin-like site-specific DNA recombinase